MKEFITIKAVGPLRDIKRLEIKSLTVLIGESAIGKSTLMKVLVMMRYLFKMVNVRFYLKKSKIAKSPFRFRIDRMKANIGDGFFGKDSFVRYEVEMPTGHTYALEIDGNSFRKPSQMDDADIVFFKESFVSENRTILPKWTERSSRNNIASLGLYFDETNEIFQRAIANDAIFDLPYMGMQLQVNHPKGKPVNLILSPTDKSYPVCRLNEASSGLQSSVPLAVIVQFLSEQFSLKNAFNRSVLSYIFENDDRLSDFKPFKDLSSIPCYVHIHLEEPELSLYPDAQYKLLEQIVRVAFAATDRRVGLIMATHSPYMLNYLNVLLCKRPGQVAYVENSDMAAYRLCDGRALNLMARGEHGDVFVDTNDLSDEMVDIFNIYRQYQSAGE